jgi:transposase-like protein
MTEPADGHRPSKIFSAFLGSAARPKPGRPPTVNKMVRDLFGSSRRKPNIHAAAADLGVHQSTVRRWLRQGKLPTRGPNAGVMEHRHQQWQQTPAGRAARISPAARRRLEQSSSVMISFTGRIRVSAKDRGARVTRHTDFAIDAKDALAILEAEIAGDTTKAHQLLQDASGDAFAGGTVGLDIDKMEMDW